MPTYEYACKECGEHLEAVQKFTDDPLTECPSCGGELRKVFGNVGIVFKGSGFYKNDSRKSTSSSTAANGSSTSESPAPAASETASKDTPAATPAPASTPSPPSTPAPAATP